MQRKSVLLLKNKNFEYILYQSNKEEIDILTNLYNQGIKNDKNYNFLDEIDICGHIKEVSEIDAKKYIPIYHQWYEQKEHSKGIELNKTLITEYKCYANINRNPFKFSSNVIIHESPLSSLICVCQSIQSEYFLILKKELDADGKHKYLTQFKEQEPQIAPIESPQQLSQEEEKIDIINDIKEEEKIENVEPIKKRSKWW